MVTAMLASAPAGKVVERQLRSTDGVLVNVTLSNRTAAWVVLLSRVNIDVFVKYKEGKILGLEYGDKKSGIRLSEGQAIALHRQRQWALQRGVLKAQSGAQSVMRTSTWTAFP